MLLGSTLIFFHADIRAAGNNYVTISYYIYLGDKENQPVSRRHPTSLHELTKKRLTTSLYYSVHTIATQPSTAQHSK